ncbi:MobQ family relaxase [Acinetobacter sp. YH1901141]|uniref:MobQ family relaxase n=1 Tax=Acinetobacter sp. YH1901141 TaxID=2601201 RepID=UPI0015D441BD|nr:MobQ family relaxase [Acinetobacter sp. YH1901141]
MAIYHFSVKAISRADGRSAIAAAAYRSGEKLIDQKQQQEQDYTRKTGVEFKKIYAPDNAKAELLDRQSLWNIVEKVENRKNSVLAREFEIAFPQELNAEQRQQLLDDLCKKIVERHNVIVDAVIHAPHTRGGSDERNYHAHILFTSRQLDKDTGEFSKNKFRDFNKEKSSETVAAWRKDFADLANHYLEKNNFDARIDHRSYADRGIDLEATWHEGVAVTAMKRRYEREQLKPVEERNPKIIMPTVALENDAIRARNAEKLANEQIIKGLDQEIILEERRLSQLKLERSQLEQQPIKPLEQPQKATATDARNAIAKYKTAIETTANKVFQEQQAKQIEDAKTWLAKIEDMRAKTPLFLGKKEHLAKIAQEVRQYEEMRSNFAKFKESGVTDEHRATAIAIIERNKPNMALNARNAEKYLQERQLEQAKEQLNPNISILAKTNNSYYGKVLQSGTQGTVQSTKDGLVYHPQIKDLKTGKEYTLTYTENQVKILENIEINRKTGKSQDNEIKR